MISPKFIKRAQSRLTRVSIKLSSESLRKISEHFTKEFSEITEENFEEWFTSIKNVKEIHLPNADEFFKDWKPVLEEEKQAKVMEESNVLKEEVEEEIQEDVVFYAEEFLKNSLNQLNMQISSQAFTDILRSIKTTFDNEEECMSEVFHALENYLVNQRVLREKKICEISEFVEDNINNSKSDVQKLQESIMNFKERNYNLTTAYSNLLQQNKQVVKMKNVMMGSVIFLSLIIFGIVPLIMKVNEKSYSQFLKNECTPSISQKLCNVKN